MKVSLIVAVSENGVIGRGLELPWRLSADLKRFKELTTGHHLVVGRRTWESIGRPLPGRDMVVVSRDPNFRAEGCRVVRSLEDAIELARAEGDDELFVGGGAQLYREALARADRVYLTEVLARVEGDVGFPVLDREQWRECSREHHEADWRNEHAFDFVVLERGP